MKKSKKDSLVMQEKSAAVVRHRSAFGNVDGFGELNGEYFSLSAGMDTHQIFKSVDGDVSQSPHWGYVLSGHLTTIDSKGRHYSFNATELFCWPPGHHVMVDADAEIVMFSPRQEHGVDKLADLAN